MRLIDADELKEKLLKMQKDIANEKESRGNAKSDTWKAAYLSIFDEYIKLLNQSPTVINDCDAAYGRGYLKGREDILKEQQQMKDYCKNDCDAIYEAYARWYSKGFLEGDKMTKDELWSKIIKDLKTLDQKAHNEEFVPVIISVLVMSACDLRTDVIHSAVKQEDKFHMWSLVDNLGCYSIKGETIMYLPEYQDLTALLRKVF